jgi:hypothetical protein
LARFLGTELADRIGLTTRFREAMAASRERRSAHDPGVVLRDLAVAIADGGDCVSDLGVLRGQEAPDSWEWASCRSAQPITPGRRDPGQEARRV